MTGRSPAGPLIREHRLIERVIGVLQSEIDAIDRAGQVDCSAIDALTDFIRGYADRCHHGKEEDILFRRLSDRRLDSEVSLMMEDLIADHVRARALTRRVAEANERYAAGDGSALSEMREALRGLVSLYPCHIEKEDKRFFKPALEYFTEEERAEMLRDFDEFDRQLIHERYRAVVEGLEASAARVRG